MKRYLLFDRKHIDEYVFLLIILLDCNFLYLIKPPTILRFFWGTYAKLGLVIITIAYCVLIRFWKIRYIFIQRYLALLVVSFVFVSVSSNNLYPYENMVFHYLQYGHMLLAFLAIPFISYFEMDNGYEGVLKKLNILCFAMYILFIFQALLVRLDGPFFMQIAHNTRYGNLRMGLSGIANMMIVYNFCRGFLGEGKIKVFNVVQFLLGILCVFFIEQTRGYEIAFCVTFGCLLLLKREKGKKEKTIIALGLIVIAIAHFLGVFDSFFSSFIEGAEVGNTEIRVEAIAYFWDTFRRNPLWGHGFISSSSYQLIKTGPKGYYLYADVGIFGLLAQMGIISVVVYIYPLIHSIKVLIISRNRKADIFLLGIVIYIITLSPTLIVTNHERIIQWPLFLALIAFFEGDDNVINKRSLLWFHYL